MQHTYNSFYIIYIHLCVYIYLYYVYIYIKMSTSILRLLKLLNLLTCSVDTRRVSSPPNRFHCILDTTRFSLFSIYLKNEFKFCFLNR